MKRILMATMALGLLMAAPAYADGKNSAKCSADFDQCLADCKSKFGADSAKHAACVPQCSGKYAACDAGVAYDKAKPWLEEQANKTKKFFDDMMNDLKKEEKPAPAEPATKPI